MAKLPKISSTTNKYGAINLTKLEAARRQLKTAISLWFSDGDPVAVHALTYAAYEIIHRISKARDPNRRDLLFDTLLIKDEYRREYSDWIKRSANFFKHADRDPDATLEFHPILSELFILFSILGLELSGERKNDEESAFMSWLTFHRTEWLSQDGRDRVMNRIPVDHFRDIQAIPKHEFLEAFRQARNLAGL